MAAGWQRRHTVAGRQEGGSQAQGVVSESTRVGVVARAQPRRKGGREGGKEEGSGWSDTQTRVG